MKNKQITNLIDLLEDKALIHPDKPAYIFLTDGKNITDSLTYGQLAEKAKAVAGYLQSRVKRGDRAILLYPSGLEFIIAFFGCIYAGIIGIPLPPPDMFRKASILDRIRTVIEDAKPTTVLTLTNLLSQLGEISSQFNNIELLSIENIDTQTTDKWNKPLLSSDNIAYLQYTSGSTGEPKGVIITHNNLLKFFPNISSTVSLQSDSKMCSWQPHFHDGGLVGALLISVYVGITCYIISPFTFIKKPLCWLQLISNYKITHSSAPNFAYDHCVSAINNLQKIENLDLSSWQTAGNGSEPIDRETLEHFTRTFAVYGFAETAFSPGYGLAENTLTVANKKQSEKLTFCRVSPEFLAENKVVETTEPEGKIIVSCGVLIPNTKVVIVNPENLTQSSSNEVGEIWVKSPSVAKGYWNKPEASKQTFKAYLADTGEGSFLRTGDLGFLKNGELFVTGRLKDLIIVRGQNYYPQDFEQTVKKCHQQLHNSSSAAFSVKVEEIEQLVIVAEIKNITNINCDEVILQIRQTIAQEYQLSVYAVILIKQGTIPKTSSGKIQRTLCRFQFLNNQLNVVYSWYLKKQNI